MSTPAQFDSDSLPAEPPAAPSIRRTTGDWLGRLLHSGEALALAGRTIQFASQLLMIVLLPRALEPSSYLALNLILPLASLGVTVLFGWFATAVHRRVHELMDPARDVLAEATLAYYGIAGIALLIGTGLGYAVTDSPYRFVPLLLAAQGMKALTIGVLNSSGRHRGFLTANAAFAASLAAFVLACFFDKGSHLWRNLALYSVADIVIAAVAYASLGIVKSGRLPRLRFDVILDCFRYGAPMVATLLATWIVSVSDRYLLGFWLDERPVASYVLSYQLAGSVITIPMSFMLAVVFPRILRIEKEHGMDAALDFNARLFAVYLRWSLLSFAAACLVVLPFMYYAYPSYIFLPGVITIVIAAHLVSASSHFLNKEFELNGRTFVLTKCMAVGAAVNLALNVALIPFLGVIGAALATLFAYAASAAMTYRSHQRRPHARTARS